MENKTFPACLRTKAVVMIALKNLLTIDNVDVTSLLLIE